jgi:hypothetical protein
MPRSEVDMALHWWETADGAPGQNQRERARVLRALAEQALVRAEPLEIKDQPDGAVNALIASETLRDLGGDRVSFRHDVLREWAIGNLLHAKPEKIGQLPLARPASAALARGVELAARTAIERSSDSKAWESLLERLSGADVHGSWRRAALLALVRSEVSPELLTRAAAYLLADRGALLRELIRVVIAVESEPAARLFGSIGMDPAMNSVFRGTIKNPKGKRKDYYYPTVIEYGTPHTPAQPFLRPALRGHRTKAKRAVIERVRMVINRDY